MTRTIIDINILQTLPPSNVNRDDTGSPKTAFYGGVNRARVSSQAQKRAARIAFNAALDTSKIGLRTKRVVEALSGRIAEMAPDMTAERALELAQSVLSTAGIKVTPPRPTKDKAPGPAESGYLLFLSARQLALLAEAAIATAADGSQLKTADIKRKLDTEHSVDIALFGRMVADQTDLNVDAAVQVAHAISVHAVENEFDYFTAVDDAKAAAEDEDAGAAMIGTVEFNSSTLYRYATIDVDRLHDNLGDVAATREAVQVFIDAFVRTLPSGKQNTFAHRTLPDAVIVTVRERQSVNLVGAFEAPVAGQRVLEASRRLSAYAAEVDTAYGTTPVASWVVRVGESTEPMDAMGERLGLDELTNAVGAAVETRLASV